MGVNDQDFNKDNGYVEDEEVQLPGFRFHPTDEELVSFYLRRKLDNKPISIDLIKQIDIYKYDPWDLPSMSTNSYEVFFFSFLNFLILQFLLNSKVIGFLAT